MCKKTALGGGGPAGCGLGNFLGTWFRFLFMFLIMYVCRAWSLGGACIFWQGFLGFFGGGARYYQLDGGSGVGRWDVSAVFDV